LESALVALSKPTLLPTILTLHSQGILIEQVYPILLCHFVKLVMVYAFATLHAIILE
jgi:hypothetical protein